MPQSTGGSFSERQRKKAVAYRDARNDAQADMLAKRVTCAHVAVQLAEELRTSRAEEARADVARRKQEAADRVSNEAIARWMRRFGQAYM